MAAALHWEVCAVDGAGQGHGRCGHRHATADEATACPWDPERPVVCDLLVRQVRTDQPRRGGGADRPLRQREAPAASMQLGLFGAAA